MPIIDISLQGGNSAELAKKLCGRKIPFLVISGYSAKSDGIDEIFQVRALGCKARNASLVAVGVARPSCVRTAKVGEGRSIGT